MRALLPLVVALASGACAENGSAGDVAEAGALFRAQCLGCHLPPDSAFAVDRAWLEQVRGTA